MPLTQLSAQDQIPYDTRSAGSGDARFRLDAGQSPRGEDSCSANATAMGYCGVGQVDGNTDSITAQAGERPMYTFAQKFESNATLPSITWHGKTNVAPSSSGTTGDIVLQIYRFGTTDGWETIKTDTASTDCSTDNCVITAQPSGTVGEYYDADGSDHWTYLRIWQYEDTTGSITFETDGFKATQTRQMLRHGRFFQGGVDQPFSF